MLKSPCNHLIVKLDKAFQDEIITPSGLKLFSQTHFNSEWYVTVTATVVCSPDKLTKSSRPDLQGLSVKAKEGDEIIISYQVVNDCDIRDRDTPIHHNLFYYNGEYFWKCDYYFLLGYVRGEKLIPAQGYIFCEELPEEKKPERVGLIWMPEMAKQEKPKGRARVIGVGEPKEDEQPLDVQEGEIVKFNQGYAQKYEVKGRNIIILRQNQILATL